MTTGSGARHWAVLLNFIYYLLIEASSVAILVVTIARHYITYIHYHANSHVILFDGHILSFVSNGKTEFERQKCKTDAENVEHNDNKCAVDRVLWCICLIESQPDNLMTDWLDEQLIIQLTELSNWQYRVSTDKWEVVKVSFRNANSIEIRAAH